MSEPPVVDGVVDPAWMSMEPATGFIQQLPETGAPATERVELVRIGFNRNTLFIGVICFDSRPEDIVSTQARRDGVLDETDSFRGSPGHLRRRPERIPLCHDSRRHRVRRPDHPRRPEPRRGRSGPRRLRGRQRLRRGARGPGVRFQPELGCGLDGPGPNHSARLGSRVRDPAPEPALRTGYGSHLGNQLQTQPAPQERAVVLGPGHARIRDPPCFDGRRADRPRPGFSFEPPGHSPTSRAGSSTITGDPTH